MSSLKSSPKHKRSALTWFGEGAVFDHVGLAVRSLAEVEVPGLEITADPRQRVSVAFVDAGGITVELIEPLGDRSPILRNLELGQPLVHLCFRVKNLDRAIVIGKAAGFHRLSTPVAAPAFGDRRIAWVFSRSFGLIELLEDAE